MKRGDIGEPTPMVAAGEAPAWLTEALPKLRDMLRFSIEREPVYPSRPELHRRLGAIEDAARLLIKEMPDLHILALLLAGDEQIENENELFHGLRDMADRAALARKPRKQGRGARYPETAIGPSSMELCALMIAVAYYQAHRRWPGKNNGVAHQACEALWKFAGGPRRLGRGKPRSPSLAKETTAAGSWGKSGSATVAVWRRYLKTTQNFRPPHNAGKIIQGIIRMLKKGLPSGPLA